MKDFLFGAVASTNVMQAQWRRTWPVYLRGALLMPVAFLASAAVAMGGLVFDVWWMRGAVSALGVYGMIRNWHPLLFGIRILILLGRGARHVPSRPLVLHELFRMTDAVSQQSSTGEAGR